MRYYDVHVELPKNGYSIGLKTENEKELTDQEIIDICIKEHRFEEDGDYLHVDTIEEISKELFYEWFGF